MVPSRLSVFVFVCVLSPCFGHERADYSLWCCEPAEIGEMACLASTKIGSDERVADNAQDDVGDRNCVCRNGTGGRRPGQKMTADWRSDVDDMCLAGRSGKCDCTWSSKFCKNDAASVMRNFRQGREYCTRSAGSLPHGGTQRVTSTLYFCRQSLLFPRVDAVAECRTLHAFELKYFTTIFEVLINPNRDLKKKKFLLLFTNQP